MECVVIASYYKLWSGNAKLVVWYSRKREEGRYRHNIHSEPESVTIIA